MLETIILVIVLLSFHIALTTKVITQHQAKETEESVLLARQIAASNATIHFTDRFFELVRDSGGDPQNWVGLPTSKKQTYQFWSLHATEFYFFHHGLLPRFMYTLWVIDLAQLFAGQNGEEIRVSQEEYLRRYAVNYVEMMYFFKEVYAISRRHRDEIERDLQIGKLVQEYSINNRFG